ncbi:hypothetical protein GC105_00805 [Alkalibaculum sp. M08DMB]|uniref:PucR C-terminal helix-turn-helix domain-containing protein n=1 Tax=Alkalibaculum sporogenes TaxID=2655001 RepID=A0A6A7K4F4_9FIRM|nr:hypothetical protein [Alkalibaculum sporogenes]
MTNTATALKIHRNSLNYRIEKICSIMNLSLDHSNVVFHLHQSIVYEKRTKAISPCPLSHLSFIIVKPVLLAFSMQSFNTYSMLFYCEMIIFEKFHK